MPENYSLQIRNETNSASTSKLKLFVSNLSNTQITSDNIKILKENTPLPFIIESGSIVNISSPNQGVNFNLIFDSNINPHPSSGDTISIQVIENNQSPTFSSNVLEIKFPTPQGSSITLPKSYLVKYNNTQYSVIIKLDSNVTPVTIIYKATKK